MSVSKAITAPFHSNSDLELAERHRYGDEAALFRLAAQRFDSIIASGVVNGRLEFNSGNCYLQAGDLGNAILHYRRAQRLIPGDE